MNREQAGMDKQDILRNYNLNVRTKPVFLSLRINPVARLYVSRGSIRYPEAAPDDVYSPYLE